MAFPLSLGYLLVKARYFAMEKGLSLRRRILWFGQESLQWTLLLGLVPIFIGVGLIFSKSRSGIMVLAVTAVLAAAAAASWRELSDEEWPVPPFRTDRAPRRHRHPGRGRLDRDRPGHPALLGGRHYGRQPPDVLQEYRRDDRRLSLGRDREGDLRQRVRHVREVRRPAQAVLRPQRLSGVRGRERRHRGRRAHPGGDRPRRLARGRVAPAERLVRQRHRPRSDAGRHGPPHSRIHRLQPPDHGQRGLFHDAGHARGGRAGGGRRKERGHVPGVHVPIQAAYGRIPGRGPFRPGPARL